ncbi:hypothetical protein GZH46_00011, partial [Fragariocoptes setiger]
MYGQPMMSPVMAFSAVHPDDALAQFSGVLDVARSPFEPVTLSPHFGMPVTGRPSILSEQVVPSTAETPQSFSINTADDSQPDKSSSTVQTEEPLSGIESQDSKSSTEASSVTYDDNANTTNSGVKTVTPSTRTTTLTTTTTEPSTTETTTEPQSSEATAGEKLTPSNSTESPKSADDADLDAETSKVSTDANPDTTETSTTTDMPTTEVTTEPSTESNGASTSELQTSTVSKETIATEAITQSPTSNEDWTTTSMTTTPESTTTQTDTEATTEEESSTSTPESAVKSIETEPTSSPAFESTTAKSVAVSAETSTTEAPQSSRPSNDTPDEPIMTSTTTEEPSTTTTITTTTNSPETTTTAMAEPEITEKEIETTSESPSTFTIAAIDDSIDTTTTTKTTPRPEITTTPMPTTHTPEGKSNDCNYLPTYDHDEVQKVFREETTFSNGTIKGKFTYISYDQRYRLVHYTRLPYGPVKVDRVEELGKPANRSRTSNIGGHTTLESRNEASVPPNNAVPPFGSPSLSSLWPKLPADPLLPSDRLPSVPLNGPSFIALNFSPDSFTTFNQVASSQTPAASPSFYAAPPVYIFDRELNPLNRNQTGQALEKPLFVQKSIEHPNREQVASPQVSARPNILPQSSGNPAIQETKDLDSSRAEPKSVVNKFEFARDDSPTLLRLSPPPSQPFQVDKFEQGSWPGYLYTSRVAPEAIPELPNLRFANHPSPFLNPTNLQHLYSFHHSAFRASAFPMGGLPISYGHQPQRSIQPPSHSIQPHEFIAQPSVPFVVIEPPNEGARPRARLIRMKTSKSLLKSFHAPATSISNSVSSTKTPAQHRHQKAKQSVDNASPGHISSVVHHASLKMAQRSPIIIRPAKKRLSVKTSLGHALAVDQ